MREKLIELLLNSDPLHERDLDDDLADGEIESIADYLLANGVIVPPCKVGDTVYIISDYTNEILDRLIIGIIIKKDGYDFIFDTQSSWSDTDIGKTVFLTHEEAEKALREGATDEKL